MFALPEIYYFENRRKGNFEPDEIFVNKLIAETLKSYIFSDALSDDWDEIEPPVEDGSGEVQYDITRNETELIDVERLWLLGIVPEKFMEDIERMLPTRNYKRNYEDFIARKVVQLVKIIKAEQPIIPDMICSMILFNIAEAEYRDYLDEDCPFSNVFRLPESEQWVKDWKKICEEMLQEELESPDDEEKGEAEIIEDFEKQCSLLEAASENLGCMLCLDADYGFGLLLRDMDYEFFEDLGLFKTIVALDNPQFGYDDIDVYEMFTSVGYDVPFGIVAATKIARKKYAKYLNSEVFSYRRKDTDKSKED